MTGAMKSLASVVEGSLKCGLKVSFTERELKAMFCQPFAVLYASDRSPQDGFGRARLGFLKYAQSNKMPHDEIH